MNHYTIPFQTNKSPLFYTLQLLLRSSFNLPDFCPQWKNWNIEYTVDSLSNICARPRHWHIESSIFENHIPQKIQRPGPILLPQNGRLRTKRSATHFFVSKIWLDLTSIFTLEGTCDTLHLDRRRKKENGPEIKEVLHIWLLTCDLQTCKHLDNINIQAW